VQKRCIAFAVGVPHRVQCGVIGEPHSPQKDAPARPTVPHFEQAGALGVSADAPMEPETGCGSLLMFLR
jgi:hypothetical protein